VGRKEGLRERTTKGKGGKGVAEGSKSKSRQGEQRRSLNTHKHSFPLHPGPRLPSSGGKELAAHSAPYRLKIISNPTSRTCKHPVAAKHRRGCLHVWTITCSTVDRYQSIALRIRSGTIKTQRQTPALSRTAHRQAHYSLSLSANPDLCSSSASTSGGGVASASCSFLSPPNFPYTFGFFLGPAVVLN
jgi:hypothetical protein